MTTPEKRDPVDRIFKRLAATYGAAWDRSLGQTPVMDVMTVWAHELSGFLQHRRAMQSVAWALENLPERCPNVIEFRNLCRAAPAVDVPKLPEPATDPDRLRAELAKLAPVKAATQAQTVDSKDWARRILARHAAGAKVHPATLQMACQGLGERQAA